MSIPIALAIILSSAWLNFNIFTFKSITGDNFFAEKNRTGKVMGAAENNGIKKVEINSVSEDSDMNNNSVQQLNIAIAAILKNAREISYANLAVSLPDTDSNGLNEAKKGPRVNEIKPMPIISAGSAVIFDVRSGRYLMNKKSDRVVSIASITKLMTALVFLDKKTEWQKIYEIKKEDKIEGGKIILFPGDKITVKDLFNLSLVSSDNVATLALARSTGIGVKDFVKSMNEKAASLGLSNTYFEDVIGLSSKNVSTAKELAKLGSVSLEQKEIKEAVLLPGYECKTVQGKSKKIINTDNLIGSHPTEGTELLGGKTGYNESAGYCFLGKFTDGKNQIISVVLGSTGKNSRFDETKKLVSWAYETYNWLD